MKIKTQFINSMVIFGIILFIIAISVIVTNQQVERLNKQEEIAEDIERGASELGYLSNDYLLYHESPQRARWESKFSELSGDLSSLNLNSPEQQTLVNNIKANQQRLKAVFTDIVSTFESVSSNQSDVVDPAFIQVSWSRMAVQNQGMAFDAERLGQMLRNQANQLKQTNITLIFALLGIFSAYFLINYLIVYRRALKSISELQEGTRIIGSGNFDFAIKQKNNDEIGELSHAFNQMTVSLKDVTASKTELEREIAERKRVENVLRESEQRWATTLASIGDAVISTDIEGRITFMNAEAEALTGWTRVEALAKPVTDVFNIINEYTRREADNPVARVLQEGGVVGLANHTILVKKDGTEVPIDDSGAPIRDRDGKTMGVVLVFRDITERKLAEEEREKTVEFLGLVNESTGMKDAIRATATFFQQQSGCEAVGIRLKDGDDYPYFETRGFPKEFILAENSLCARDSAGYPINECMCGNVICGRFDPSKPFFTKRGSFWTNSTTELLATSTEADLQARTRNRCNGEGYESVGLIALHIGKERLGLLQLNDRRKGLFSPEAISLWEQLAGHLAIALAKFRIEDALRKTHNELELRVQERTAELEEANRALQAEITERKWAEKKIREQAALLDKAHDAIGVRDLDHHLIYWNKGAQRLYGWTAYEAIDKNADKLLYKEESSRLIEAKKSVIDKGEWNGELGQITKDGKRIIVESRWTLMRDDEEKPVSILIINTDITEKKKFESQLLRAQRMESIGTLAGGIAHDLNNMLTPIMLSLHILKGKFKDEQSQKLLTILEKNSQRGADLIKQVLSFARGVEGERNPLAARHIITEIEKVAKETFPRNIEIRTDIPKDLFTISGDATQLHQVIMNLCLNARDAMPDGGILSITGSNFFIDESYVRMSTEAKVGSYVTIAVSDTGIGIPPDILDRIFEPFFSTKEFGKGTGLGLSTSLAIAKSHGGFINVYSEVGRGTEFRVYLPAIKTEIQNVEEEKLELPKGQGELVLVAEDEDSIREITISTLEKNGYKVITACDGVEAISLYAQNVKETRVILMDMMMPVMDGLSSIRAIRKINPQVRVIAVSGLAEKDKLKNVADHTKAFLPKPYTAERLLKTIYEVINENLM